MARHLKLWRTSSRGDRGDIPVMTVVVMLMGSSLIAVSAAAAAIAGHAATSQSRLNAYNNAVSLDESALSTVYAGLQSDPNYLTDGSAPSGWDYFSSDGQVEPCPNQGGVAGLPYPGGQGCWEVQVQATNQGASAGTPINNGSNQTSQAATVTVTSHIDCHGTLTSCTTLSAVQHFSRRDFLDFLYFTTQDVMSPSFSSSGLCGKYAGCSEPAYHTGDVVDGPVYTGGEVWVCGSPTFDAMVESTSSPVWSEPQGAGSCAGSSPQFLGGTQTVPQPLSLPAFDSYLPGLAARAGSPWPGQPGYDFAGNVTVAVNGATLTVNGHSGVPFPSDGVLASSGDIFVQGSVAGGLTLYAAGNIYVTGTLDYSCAPSGPVPPSCHDYTGLVAGGSVYIDDTGAPITVDAAMVAPSGSVSINPADLTPCTGTCPVLHLDGALASEYRGVFGAYDNSGIVGEGFVKDFRYDSRLFHNSPPWLLSGGTGEWSETAPSIINSGELAAASSSASSVPTTLPPPTTTTTVAPTTTTTTTVPQPVPACQSATEVAGGSTSGPTPNGGEFILLWKIPVCQTVAAGTTVLAGVSTLSVPSSQPTVSDSVGNTWSPVVQEPGVYLWGAKLAKTLPAGGDVVVRMAVKSSYSLSAIAEEAPGVEVPFVIDGTAQSGYEAPSPVSTSYKTTMTEDDLVVLAAGGGTTANVSPTSMSTDQIVSKTSTVFASRDVGSGAHSSAVSWSPTTSPRSWLEAALVMQGATKAVPVHLVVNGCTPKAWTVPAGVSSVQFVVTGASGGQGFDLSTGKYEGGGLGSSVTGTLPVTPGQELELYPSEPGSGGLGGCGYGTGGSASIHGVIGGGGGGSSAIYDMSTHKLLVIGAGGGGAYADPGAKTAGGASNAGYPEGYPLTSTPWMTPWRCFGGSGALANVSGDGGGDPLEFSASTGYSATPCGFSSGQIRTYAQGEPGQIDDPATGNTGSAAMGPGNGNGGNANDLYKTGYPDASGGGGGAGYYGGGGGGAYVYLPTKGSPGVPYAGPGGGGSSWASSSASGVSYGSGPPAPAAGPVSITYTS